jgi:hypothetical protein
VLTGDVIGRHAPFVTVAGCHWEAIVYRLDYLTAFQFHVIKRRIKFWPYWIARWYLAIERHSADCDLIAWVHFVFSHIFGVTILCQCS